MAPCPPRSCSRLGTGVRYGETGSAPTPSAVMQPGQGQGGVFGDTLRGGRLQAKGEKPEVCGHVTAAQDPRVSAAMVRPCRWVRRREKVRGQEWWDGMS